MLVTTLGSVPGKSTVRILGMVSGNTVRAKHIGKDIFAGLKQIVGGELKGYTDMMTDAREEAMQRMIENAQQMGANAILCVRVTTSDIMSSASEVLCYGTAVVI